MEDRDGGLKRRVEMRVGNKRGLKKSSNHSKGRKRSVPVSGEGLEKNSLHSPTKNKNKNK